MKKPDINFGVIVTSRSFFPVWLAEEGRKEIQAKLDSLNYGYVMPTETMTPHGVVETYQDAKVCANLFRENRDIIKGIIVVLPNFGDETAVSDTIRLAGLDVPVLVMAYDDELELMDLDHRRDSFCGKLSVCNNLYYAGIKYSLTSTHTCKVDDPEFESDLRKFAAVCNIVCGVRNIRIGLIGARPDPFRTVRCSEKMLQNHGITVVPLDLSEIISMAQAYHDQESIEARVEQIRNYAPLEVPIAQEKFILQAKMMLTIEKWLKDNECVASAMQCWNSLQKNYGVASCLAMSMMGEAGMPSACETDVMGALSMYILQLASGNPSGYMDWNNGISSNRNKCVNIHCSNYPKSFIQAETKIGNLDIMSRSIGEDICFGALKCVVGPGPFTFAKVSTDDRTGKIKAYVGEGAFTDDRICTPGGPAVCHVDHMQDLMRYICLNGFEHHVALNRCEMADVLSEALGTYLGWDVYRHR